jgi:CMP/dCMP kinase
MIVAVDGPAASGKGTIARAIAARLGLPHLDTGLLYRAVGLSLLKAGADLHDEAAALAACSFDPAIMEDPALRSEESGGAASRVSAMPAVRAALIERQRSFARQPGGAVLDGRDIGTVIAPDAEVKLFVTASAEVRARRRASELTRLGAAQPFAAVLADIEARDARDRARATAPLRQAADARLLDTTALGLEEAVDAAFRLVDDVLAA